MPPKKKAKLDDDAVHWEYKDDSGIWHSYNDADTMLLEDSYSESATALFSTTKLSFNKGYDTKYTFDFSKNTQTNLDTKKVRDIRRIAPIVKRGSPAPAKGDDSQWEWMDDAGLYVAFYDDDNDLIERAYQATPSGQFKTTKLSFNAGYDTPYVFDFTKMEQLNTESNNIRKIQRSKKAGAWKIAGYGMQSGASAGDDGTPAASAVATPTAGPDPTAGMYPDYWAPRKGACDIIDIDLDSSEATRTLKNFHKTLKRTVKIKSLKRVQNYSLWMFYHITRLHVSNLHKGDPNEMMLFHGCRVRANMDAIINFGFDMRVAANGLYGVGIYFAVNAQYSDSGYVLQNSDKSKEMFICRVTCGKGTVGNGGLRRPPPISPKNPTGQLYDSVYNSGKETIMHIVFNNSQAYPEYIVHYV